MQLGAAGEQFLQRRRIALIVFRHHPAIGGLARLLDDALIVFRQRIPFFQVDEAEQHRAAFPPAGIVVVRRDLVEAELLVVIGPDPLRRVDRALFERRIDVAAGELLRHDAELLHDAAGKAADAHLQPLQIVDGLDLLAEPAAHLAAGIAGQKRRDVVALVELVEQLPAAAQHVPGLVDALVGAERHRRAESKSRVLAEIIVGRRMAHLDGAVLHGIEHLQAGNDFAGGKGLDLEFVVGGFGHELGHQFDAAPQRVERFRPARRQTPFDFRHRLRDGGGRQVAAPAAPIPVTLRKSLLFIESIPVGVRVDRPFLARLGQPSMEHSVPDFHPELYGANEKARPPAKTGLLSTT